MSPSWDEDCKLTLSHCCLFRDPRSRVRGVHLSLLKALFLELNLMENNVGVEWERLLVALADCLQIRKTVDAHAGFSGDGVIRWLAIRGMACICCNFWEKKNILMKNEGCQQMDIWIAKVGCCCPVFLLIMAFYLMPHWPFELCHGWPSTWTCWITDSCMSQASVGWGLDLFTLPPLRKTITARDKLANSSTKLRVSRGYSRSMESSRPLEWGARDVIRSFSVVTGVGGAGTDKQEE